MAVAFVALLAALSGTAVALPGKNTVDTGDIKKNAVRSSDIKNGAVGTKDIKNNDVRSGDVRNNTLTGADINESSLGTVPSANNANSANTANSANSANTANFANNAGAVNGTGVRRLAVDVGPNSSTTVLALNGLTLTLACDGSGQGTLTATTSVNDSDLYFWGYDTDNQNGSVAGITGNDLEDGAFDVGSTVDISDAVGDGDSDTAQGQIDYFHPGGVSGGVTVHYVLNSFAGPAPSDNCQVSGFAIG